ncbi:MAG: hypothetical protein ABI181_06390 [Mycobacteriaceae bacterium]
MFVLTVDQRRSRRDADRVPELLALLASTPVVRGFERTAGDEVQGVLDDPGAVVNTVLALVRSACWSIGVGVGTVAQPLPASTRAGRGPAFERARDAVEAAKTSPSHVSVVGAEPVSAQHAGAVLDLLALVVARRSDEGWAAVELVRVGATQTAAAAALGITKQAVSQRLRATAWGIEVAGRSTASALLARAADGTAR